MALNLSALGKQIGPITKNYHWKDAVLYALGVGAGFDELQYTYEKNLKVIPTFAAVTLFDFFVHVAVAANMNPAGILHSEQDIIFHHPLPTSGTMTTEGAITHYFDKGSRGAVVIARSDTQSDGIKLFTSTMTLFGRLDGNFGGAEPPRHIVEFPQREPDFVVDALPSPNQPLIYRLSGDIFQLHVDPDFAQSAGFEKPIMHGLCTYGFACRALMASLIPGEPEKAERLGCRFSQILYPGDPIKTLIWKTGEGKTVWKTVNAKTNEIVIDSGVFEYGDISKDAVSHD